jgi:RNA polymerase sigma-54 factor
MLKPSLQLKLTQQLTMTPQLQQAIRLLQLPIMELQVEIQQALDENVMLEAEEPEAPEEATENAADADEPDADADPEEFSDGEPEVAVATEAEWEDTQKTGPAEAPKSAEPPTTFEYADRSEETLRDHLLWQLELENLDARTTTIGQAIIDAINDDGYLTDDLPTIRATLAPDVVATTDEV